MSEDLKGTIVWVWSDDELDAIGSGRRRVRWIQHPTRKKFVKVYPAHAEGYPVVVSKMVMFEGYEDRDGEWISPLVLDES